MLQCCSYDSFVIQAFDDAKMICNKKCWRIAVEFTSATVSHLDNAFSFILRNLRFAVHNHVCVHVGLVYVILTPKWTFSLFHFLCARARVCVYAQRVDRNYATSECDDNKFQVVLELSTAALSKRMQRNWILQQNGGTTFISSTSWNGVAVFSEAVCQRRRHQNQTRNDRPNRFCRIFFYIIYHIMCEVTNEMLERNGKEENG